MHPEVDVQDVIAAERQRRNALLRRDVPAMEALFSDELVHVHTTGIIHNKAQIIRHATETLQFKDVIRGALTVRVFDDVAVMTGPQTNIVLPAGQSEDLTIEAFVTQVWHRESGCWRALRFHATRIVPSRPAGA